MYRNRERNGADDPNELGMCIHDLQRRNGSSNILSLLPTLDKEKDVLIMDNMRSHHAKQVQAVLAAAGVKVLFLPPYSPDLNPIERLWSKFHLAAVQL